MDIEKEIREIQARNKRVEADKAWEISSFRKFVIVLLTYFLLVIFLKSVRIGNPWLNAIVPSIGFFLSTITLPIVKRWWVGKYYNDKL